MIVTHENWPNIINDIAGLDLLEDVDLNFIDSLELEEIEFEEIEFELEDLPQFADLSDLITLSSTP